MAILAVEIAVPDAVDVKVSKDTLSVDLTDGRTISVPLGWYPRLEHASPKERAATSLTPCTDCSSDLRT
ncbi:MAG: DUF2442 domain-containing protein, partial [Candidatus Desulfacyla sp.]